jgi:hypothetical protein
MLGVHTLWQPASAIVQAASAEQVIRVGCFIGARRASGG